MAVQVHAHEGGELQEAGIDAAHRAGVAPGHGADQVLLEPLDRLAGGQFVDLGGVDAAVDRPGHQRHAARLRRVVVLCHQRHRGQGRHARLAHRHQVRARAQPLDEGDHVFDVLVQAEAAFRQRHIAGVVPVGDVHVVVGEHGARGVVQQCGEVARQRRHDQHLRAQRVLGLAQVVAHEALQRAEGQRVHRDLAHRHLALADAHRIDAERQAAGA